METWQVILYVLFASVVHAGLFSMIGVALMPRQFLDWYRPKLARWALQRSRKAFAEGEYEGMANIAGQLEYEDQAAYYIEYAIGKKLFWFKVLGGCMYCTNIWFALLTCWVWGLALGIGWWCAFVPVLAAAFFRVIQTRTE